MRIYIGSDHAGFELKEKLKEYLSGLGYSSVKDEGAFSYNPTDDYPDFITPVARDVSEDKGSMGIILGGSGQGEMIDANKIEGVRAIEYYGRDLQIVVLGRKHNDANILSLGARFISLDEAKKVVKIFLETPFSGDKRHIRRIKKIEPRA